MISMNTHHHIKAILCLLLTCAISFILASCDKPTYIPPVPSPTPAPRLAPEGILYVTERFSVSTDTGLHGFSVGKQVRLIRIDGPNYLVTDGLTEGSAPATSFTNDLDVLDALVSKGAVQRKTQEQRQQEIINESKRTKQLLEAQRKQDLRVARNKQLDQWIDNAETQIRLLQEEISQRRGYSQSTPEHRERLSKIKELSECITQWRKEKSQQ